MSEAFVPLNPAAQLGYLLVVAADQQSRSWQKALRDQEINPRQFSMLASLAHDPGISQAELARRVMITPQSLSESLTRLLDARLIVRGNTGPGRASRLVLTDAGRTLLAQAYPVVEAFDRASFEGLTDTERAELTRLLSKVLAAGRRSDE